MIGMWLAGCRFLLANSGRGLQAVHLRHLDIHENCVETLLFVGPKDRLPVPHRHDRVSPFLHEANGHSSDSRGCLLRAEYENGGGLLAFRSRCSHPGQLRLQAFHNRVEQVGLTGGLREAR